MCVCICGKYEKDSVLVGTAYLTGRRWPSDSSSAWLYGTSRGRPCPIFEAMNTKHANGVTWWHGDTGQKTGGAGIYLDFFAVDLDGLHRKVHADGVALVLGVRAALEPLHNARLAGAAVADQHDFEQKVEIVLDRHHGHSRGLGRRRRRRRAGRGRTGRFRHGRVGVYGATRTWRAFTATAVSSVSAAAAAAVTVVGLGA